MHDRKTVETCGRGDFSTDLVGCMRPCKLSVKVRVGAGIHSSAIAHHGVIADSRRNIFLGCEPRAFAEMIAAIYAGTS